MRQYINIIFLFLISVTGAFSATEENFNFSIDAPSVLVGSSQATIAVTLLDRDTDEKVDYDDSLEFLINSETKILNFKDGRGDFKIDVNRSRRLKICKSDDIKSSQNFFIRKYPPVLSLLPPLLAIILAIVFKEVISALFIGIFAGILLLTGTHDPVNWIRSPMIFVDTYVLDVFANRDKTAVIVFSMLICGMVSLIMKNGGMHKLVEKFTLYVKTRRNTMISTWLIGILIFFDDYANTLIVGNSLRPLSDKFKISREKLAYIGDSTAAPVAAIAVITTWIGAQLNYISDSLDNLPIEISPYLIFLNSLPFAFYPIFTIVFVFLIVYSGRDYGKMLTYERNAVADFDKSIEIHNSGEEKAAEKTPDNARWYDAILPVASLIVVAFISLIYTGTQVNPGIWASSDSVFWMKLLKVIGDSDSFRSLLWASLFGVGVSMLITLLRRSLGLRKSVHAVVSGFKSMLLAIIILILAWSLSMIIEDLHTATYLSEILSDNIPIFLFSTLVFLMSGVISFATGSSWGTMALLYPIILPVTVFICKENGCSTDETMNIFFQVVAGVLGGSVFGDHCSPISDTTILSSMASKCNHIRHVRTQLPYAVTVGLISSVTGYLFVSVLNVSPLWSFMIGIVLLIGIVKFIGKKVNVSGG